MKFRFMGPCLTRIQIRPEYIVSAEHAYLKFWDHVRQRLAAQDNDIQIDMKTLHQDVFQFEEEAGEDDSAYISFSHKDVDIPHSVASLESRQILYQTVLADTPMLPAHAAEFKLRVCNGLWDKIYQNIIDTQEAYYKGLSREDVEVLSRSIALLPQTTLIRLYYSNIFIIQFDVQISPSLFENFSSKEERALALNAIEWFGIEVFKQVASISEQALAEMLRGLQTKASAKIVAIAKEAPSSWPPSLHHTSNLQQSRVHDASKVAAKAQQSTSRRGPALWVTRSLFFEETRQIDDADIPELLECWLTPVSHADWRGAIKNTGYSMQWLRYGFDEKIMADKKSDFTDAWESMLFSQFFWAAMETVEHDMFAALGRLNSKVTRGGSLKASYQNLIQVRETAELTLAHYEHLKRYLTRTRVKLVEQIMDGWGFKSMVKNLRDTIMLCNQRHHTLLQRASAQNSLFTDILLFFIGTVAIIELMITMSITGRTLSSDAALGLRNEGELDVLGLLSTLPMDRLLLSSVVIIGIIVYFYVRYRARQVL